MKPIDDKAKNGDWIVIPISRLTNSGNQCPWVLVRWAKKEVYPNKEEEGFFDGYWNIYHPDWYMKLI